MKKVTVELDYETIDNIVLNQLLETLESLKADCENRKTDSGMAVFEMDKDADIALMSDHIKALEIVLSYFGYRP